MMGHHHIATPGFLNPPPSSSLLMMALSKPASGRQEAGSTIHPAGDVMLFSNYKLDPRAGEPANAANPFPSARTMAQWHIDISFKRIELASPSHQMQRNAFISG